MPQLDRATLSALGQGTSIEEVCSKQGWSRDEFDQRWRASVVARAPEHGDHTVAVESTVTIARDELGIPSIYAENEGDLFFGFGLAMAEDRLFQLDYLRRKGWGRLAEILGRDGYASDLVARTVGLNRIAGLEWDKLSPEVRARVERFSDGINEHMQSLQENWPIEFALLDYEPEAWSPLDCIAIEVEFRWYLTGRFPIITIPELAKRTLGAGARYEEFVLGEADEEAIVSPDEIAAMGLSEVGSPQPIGTSLSDPDATTGSNNWVLGGRRTSTGKPLLASDPHIAFEAVSCWYEAHLCGGGLNVAGMTYVGMPAIMFGRNEHIAWGITNNICSQRDLYLETESDEHPKQYLYDGAWNAEKSLTETIAIRGEGDDHHTIRFSHNGPIVNEILPAAAQDTGTVSLKWLGTYEGGWLTSLQSVNRAETIEQFREALRPWHVPTFSMVVAETSGRIGFQTSGRIPVRQSIERGYRCGADPDHQWQGVIPYDEMPFMIEPDREYVATANNRLAGDSYPHLLHGCWNSGWRAVRIRSLIEGHSTHDADAMGRMQLDHRSLRAEDLTPPLLEVLDGGDDARFVEIRRALSDWDYTISPNSIAPSIFNAFFREWTDVVVGMHFSDPTAEFVAGLAHGVAGRLLRENRAEWFESNQHRIDAIHGAMTRTLDRLAERFGEDMSQWKWGNLHVMPLRHVLGARGDLAQLLNFGGAGVGGDMWTVGNTGCGPDFEAVTGAGYRMVCDLSTSPPQLQAVDGQGQSGCPGSAHYTDQYATWLAGGYHTLTLTTTPTGSEPVRYSLSSV